MEIRLYRERPTAQRPGKRVVTDLWNYLQREGGARAVHAPLDGARIRNAAVTAGRAIVPRKRAPSTALAQPLAAAVALADSSPQEELSARMAQAVH